MTCAQIIYIFTSDLRMIQNIELITSQKALFSKLPHKIMYEIICNNSANRADLLMLRRTLI